MFKKMLPLVVMVLMSACANVQEAPATGKMCDMPCCKKCECCKDKQCSCSKGGKNKKMCNMKH